MIFQHEQHRAAGLFWKRIRCARKRKEEEEEKTNKKKVVPQRRFQRQLMREERYYFEQSIRKPEKQYNYTPKTIRTTNNHQCPRLLKPHQCLALTHYGIRSVTVLTPPCSALSTVTKKKRAAVVFDPSRKVTGTCRGVSYQSINQSISPTISWEHA
jgi:hypothetical protein